MPRTMIEDLKNGDRVDQVFLVQAKALRTARNGSLYMHLELADRTGKIGARMWDARRDVFESFQPDDFIRVKGAAETYQNRLQLIVQSVERRPASEVDLADFLPTTARDVDEMYARLIEIAKTVRHPGLRQLLAAFLKDPEVEEKFQRAPAAIQYHHAFLGGLLEHTLGVSELALLIAERYPDLDREMLLAGAILHDIGKIDEFHYDRAFTYSDTGQLLGHLYMGARMIEERAKDIPDLSPGTAEALVHLVLSHHGAYEYQSPKLPMTAEALAVHHLDNLDAKLNAFRAAMLRDRDPDSHWTDWNRMFERRLFKGHDPGE